LFVTLWEFEVKPGSEELFERTYGSDGEWAKLFRQDARYRGTRLLRDVDWECEGMTGREEHLGEYEA
jgi:hypothetical protein